MKKANFNNWIFTTAMPRVALAAIVAIMAGLSLFALWQTMTATDDVDRERAAVAINALLLNHVQRLEIYTAEQAYSDEVAQELYANAGQSGSIRNDWLETSLSEDHDIAFAYSDDGKQHFAVEAGESSTRNFRALHASAIAGLTKRITETSDCVGGIVWADDGPRLLTVARVRPISDEALSSLVQSRPAYIALSKPLDPDLLAHIGQSLGINGILIDQVGVAKPGLASIAVSQQVGARKMALYWQPARPGKEALARSLPPILVVLLGGIALVWLLSRLIGRLLSAALRDALSHLPNRRALELRIASEAGRQKSQLLALIDLDGFKRINDNYGSRIGDQAIKAIAEMLIRVAPDNATVARLGGDEFAVLSSDDDKGNSLMNAMEAFHRQLAEPLILGDVRLHLSATTGFSGALLASADAAQDLLVQSDRALGVAKQRCRGQMLVYDAALAREFAEQAALATQIESALEQDLLAMHFQPLAEAQSGQITAAEALLRWHPEAGITAGPEKAIAAAELHGLGMKLAMAVLQDACRHGAFWPDIRVAVNVTPAQFLDPELPRHIAGILAASGMTADRLELEVTETIAVADEAIFAQQFARLHAMGIHLALDDFGSGYASIGFLRRFPFQKLKIDKSLMDDSVARAACREMLVACVSAARALSITTVAEGIETEEHRLLARAAGCNLLQGYHIGKPMPAAQFSDLLASQNPADVRRLA